VIQIEYYTERVKRMVGKVHLQRHHPLRPGRLRIGGRRGGGLFAHAEACGFGHWGPPPHPDQRLDQIPDAHPGQGPLRMLRGRPLLGTPRIKEPWRWTTSSPKTKVALTTSAPCSPSASAATPPSDGRWAVCSAGWRPAAGCCWRTHWKLCIADADPVTPGRSLVIPRRHGADGLELHQPEWSAVVELPHPIVHKWTSTC
jgi:hypothetical protein